MPAMPLSRGAQIAGVIGEFYQALRRKEMEKKGRARELEDLALKYSYGQREAREAAERQKELKAYELEHPSELEQAQTEYWKGRYGEERANLEEKLAKQLRENEFLNEQARLNRILFEIEKQGMQSKYGGKGIPRESEEYKDLVKRLQDSAKYLQAEMETYAGRDDDVSKKAYQRAQKDLDIIEERLSYLQKIDPYGYLWATQEMEREKRLAAPPEEKPGFMSKAWQFVKKLPGEAKEMVEREAPEKPKAPENVGPEPVKGKMSKFNMYYAGKAFWDEEKLDYLTWYVTAHPEDEKAMRKWKKLQNDQSLEWYFGEYRGTGGGY